jgi:hypothetical protein
MGGRTAATQIVVIHAGQIVVHQRICVDGLNGSGDAGNAGGIAAHGSVGCQQ